jgi:hypothetical protein
VVGPRGHGEDDGVAATDADRAGGDGRTARTEHDPAVRRRTGGDERMKRS